MPYFIDRLYKTERRRERLVINGNTIQSRDIHIKYNKPTRCNSGSIVLIKNYKYALHVSDALCLNHQEHYKL